MKIPLLIVDGILVSVASCALGQVTPVPGTELEIGSSGSNQVVLSGSAFGSGAIGMNNSVERGLSLAIGYNNMISGGASGMSLALGEGNYVNAYWSTVIGYSNTLDDSNEEGNFVGSALVVGNDNTVNMSYANLVAGQQNTIGNGVSSSATLGHGLYNTSWLSATIVGSWNTEPLLAAPLIFGIGNGDENNRKNAFEVYKDGTIVMRKAQGDILMGEFGN